jgi:hypothetical protein
VRHSLSLVLDAAIAAVMAGTVTAVARELAGVRAGQDEQLTPLTITPLSRGRSLRARWATQRPMPVRGPAQRNTDLRSRHAHMWLAVAYAATIRPGVRTPPARVAARGEPSAGQEGYGAPLQRQGSGASSAAPT